MAVHAGGKIAPKERAMPTCQGCGEEVDELQTVKVDGKKKKICEDCADRSREAGAIAEESEAVVQNMMGFKGRR
jgi:ribosome-binding protein aMBF1 (putative translation factor)